MRLDLLSEALSGKSTLFPLVSDTTLDTLMPTSPLRQALGLLLGKSAGLITLADLQDITYLSVGSEYPPPPRGRRLPSTTTPPVPTPGRLPSRWRDGA